VRPTWAIPPPRPRASSLRVSSPPSPGPSPALHILACLFGIQYFGISRLVLSSALFHSVLSFLPWLSFFSFHWFSPFRSSSIRSFHRWLRFDRGLAPDDALGSDRQGHQAERFGNYSFLGVRSQLLSLLVGFFFVSRAGRVGAGTANWRGRRGPGLPRCADLPRAVKITPALSCARRA